MADCEPLWRGGGEAGPTAPSQLTSVQLAPVGTGPGRGGLGQTVSVVYVVLSMRIGSVGVRNVSGTGSGSVGVCGCGRGCG